MFDPLSSNIQHISGKANTADSLSQSPLTCDNSFNSGTVCENNVQFVYTHTPTVASCATGYLISTPMAYKTDHLGGKCFTQLTYFMDDLVESQSNFDFR